MGTKEQKSPSTATIVIVGVIVLFTLGWLVFHTVPRGIRAQVGLVASTDKFSYSSWRSEMKLTLDEDGRAVLEVTETIVAQFPDRDQNKGIVRGIPAPSSYTIDDITATDETGRDVLYDTDYDYDNDVQYILTGTDAYLRGEQTYVLRYVVRSAMVKDSDTEIQELYWNLLPLDSAQRIDNFSATVQIPAELAGSLNGDSACYQGRYGSTDTCTLTSSAAGDGSQVFEVGSGPREAGDGVTVAIGFAPDTVPNATWVHRDQPDSIKDILGRAQRGEVGVLVILAGLAVALAALRFHHAWRGRTRRPAPAELPPLPVAGVPTTVPPPVAAAIVNADTDEPMVKDTSGARAGRAEMIHLAVQGVVEIGQDLNAAGRPIRITVLDPSRALHRLDQEMLAALTPTGGASTLSPTDAKLAARIRKVGGRGLVAAIGQGFLHRPRHPIPISLGILALLLAVLGVAAMIANPIETFSIVIGVVALIVHIPLAVAIFRPDAVHTQQGAAIRDLLLSVRAHLKDRDAQVPVDDDGVWLTRAERLLPYAILFGLDKSWSKVLSAHYEQVDRSPTWMTHNHLAFAGAWTSMDRTVSKVSSYTPPSSSSSSGGGGYSGGSSGGGFSGGGGGGGFSGGR